MSHITIYFDDKPVYLTDDLEGLGAGRAEFQKDPKIVYMEGTSNYHLQSMPAEILKPDHTSGIICHDNLPELRDSFFSQFTVITAAGGLILNEKGEILLILRRSKWDLPKGKLDEEETIEQCAVREVKEETGLLHVDLVRQITTTYHAYTEQGIRILKETHWFKMKADSSQNLIPQSEEDISDIKWVAADEANECLKNSYENIRVVIDKAFS